MTDAVEEIRAREREVISALLNGDVARLDGILAPAFVYTASEIGFRDRSEWLDGVTSYQLDVLEMLEMEIDLYGDAAIVNARVRQHAVIHGLPRIGNFLVTDCWVCLDGAWRIVSRTSIAEPAESL